VANALENMSRFVGIALLGLCIGNGLGAQSAPTTQPAGSPEAGFVSSSKYTNSFFGFALPIPQNAQLHSLSLPSRSPSPQFLFGVQSQEHGLTVLTVTAVQTAAASSEEARKAASGPKGQSAKRVDIDGKEFWKSESQDKSSAGKMRTVKYATALGGYVLEFNIVSFNSKLTDELEQSIESVKFFDPAKAKEIAGIESQPYNPAVAPSGSSSGVVPKPNGRIKELSPGTIAGSNYTNTALGFSYQFPDGWFLADKATQEKVTQAGHEAAWGNDAGAAREHEAAQNCMKVLLWANKFQYQEGTHTEDVNPLIVVFAADPDCFPGTEFPTSSDDHEGAKNIAQAIVRSFQRTPLMGRGNMKLGTFTIQGHLFLDVSGMSQVNVPGRSAPVELYNSMVFTSSNEFWIVWAFSSGSEAGLHELKRTRIVFSNSNIGP
jgi:hypothetical protein